MSPLSPGSNPDQFQENLLYPNFVMLHNIAIIFDTFLSHNTKKATIDQVTTMLATSKNILRSSHLLTIGTDDLTLWLPPLLAFR